MENIELVQTILIYHVVHRSKFYTVTSIEDHNSDFTIYSVLDDEGEDVSEEIQQEILTRF